MSAAVKTVNLLTERTTRQLHGEGWWLKLDRFIQLWYEECAQGVAEYGLIIALIVLFILASFQSMVKAIPSGIEPVADKLTSGTNF
ncbi:Flp family type IVb pilin [Desulforamulus hydrothermalis]|uniref:Flp/Fap pilin component n=1 Tax=Desulforamulus hydrothermalis Lam5 = DSM 18033 TaxID=1121428 RepID=K8EE04_9FIRM|nr:hypothetical protein [Desulforamulus hydrothermalis]CCO07031.1 conserved hypothetical protein [Desulforamulus hydrothermalis Lam5 = DSM 18033]SHG97193.1 hypothetical protein SAMN02745177_00946 [Desulforamulus hydrothermalis Lam5 = DSM 18033]